MTPLTGIRVLEQYFLEARCKILDVAAILDRIDRGGGVPDDPRLVQIKQAIQTLLTGSNNRAEQVQLLFSLPYDANWERPTPKG
ncbi:MAG: hypothetical protein N2112_14555 [Gemmataceae bacterium]|jgi:hypothetical protein|nr:hypothetical protein [Gemmataceae bacterium]